MEQRALHFEVPGIQPRHMMTFEELVDKILYKADGVFLWVSLVLDALCDRLAHRQDLNSLAEHVDDFPRELEDYFRKLIYDRISETYKYSETAMALSVQMRFRDYPWPLYAMDYFVLSRGTRRPQSFILRKDFVFDLPFGLYDDISPETIVHEAHEFVMSRCKDLITHKATEDGLHSTFEFTHRTIFDFLQTSEMQQVVQSHVPEHFNDRYLLSQIILAATMMGGSHFESPGSYLSVSLSGSQFNDRSYLLDMPEPLLSLYERTAFYHMEKCRPARSFRLGQSVLDDYWGLAMGLIFRNRPECAKQLVQLEPALVSCLGISFPTTDVLSASLGFCFYCPQRHMIENEMRWQELLQDSTRFDMVQWLLHLRADPNKTSLPSPWVALLTRLENIEQVLDFVQTGKVQVLSFLKPEEPRAAVIPVDKIHLRRSFVDGRIRSILKLMIEYGADLDANITRQPLELDKNGQLKVGMLINETDISQMAARDVIRTRLPGECLLEWEYILDEFSDSKTCDKVRHERRLAIKDWSLHLLSESDLSLLGLDSHKCRAARRRRIEQDEATLTDVDSDEDPKVVDHITVLDSESHGQSHDQRRKSISLPLPLPQRTRRGPRARWTKNEITPESVDGVEGLKRMNFRTKEEKQRWKSRSLYQEQNFRFFFSKPLPFLREEKKREKVVSWPNMKTLCPDW